MHSLRALDECNRRFPIVDMHRRRGVRVQLCTYVLVVQNIQRLLQYKREVRETTESLSYDTCRARKSEMVGAPFSTVHVLRTATSHQILLFLASVRSKYTHLTVRNGSTHGHKHGDINPRSGLASRWPFSSFISQ